MAMELRDKSQRRAPRRFEEELDRIYAPEVPEQPVIRPASRPARPIFHATSKPFNPHLRPAAFPTLPPDNRQLSFQSNGAQDDQNGAMDSTGPDMSGEDDSLIVKLKPHKDALGSFFVSLRDLVKREDSREATAWSAKRELRSTTDIDNGRAFMKDDISCGMSPGEQYDTHLTLASMEDDMDNPETAQSTKIDLSGLHPMVRCTILMNMYIDALKEGFQNPLFPIQRLLDMPEESIMQALNDVKKAYIDDEYPDCMLSLAMGKHIVQARRFLVQQNWPWRFLDPVDLAEYTPDPAMQLQHAHAPEGVQNMPAADLIFFGRRKEVQPKDLGGTLLAPRNIVANEHARDMTRNASGRARVTISFDSQEHSQRRMLRLEEMAFAEGAAQQELQRLRLRERRGQSLPSGEQEASSSSTSEKYFQPQLVYSPSMPKSNIFTFPVTALNKSLSPPASPRSAASASPREMLFPTTPSSPPASDLPSTIYGAPCVKCSEAEVLKMLGAATTAAISHGTACSPSPTRGGEASDTPAARSMLPEDDEMEEQSHIIPVRPIRPSQQLITQTPPSTPTTMEIEPSSPSLQRQQRQIMRRRSRPALRMQSSSASAMLLLFERNYHRRIQEQQAAQAFVQVGSLRDVLTPREDPEQDQQDGYSSTTTESTAATTVATSPADHYSFSPNMTPQPSSPRTPSSRTDSAPGSRFNFSFSRPLPSSAAPAVATPPSSVPVAPMMSTQTAIATDSSNGHSGVATRPLPHPLPNIGQRRHITAATTGNRPHNGGIRAQLALPSSADSPGNSSNSIGNISSSPRDAIRAQLALPNSVRKKSADKIEHLPPSPSPLGSPLGTHLAAAHTPDRSADVVSEIVIIDDEGKKQKVIVVDGGQEDRGVPFGMFMEGLVECAESD